MRSSKTPAAPAPQYAAPPSDGPRAFPILDAFDRIGVETTKGYSLVNSGELQTFMIGRNRYATEEAIRAFLQRCIERSKTETAAQRAQKVAAGVNASLRSRGVRQAA